MKNENKKRIIDMGKLSRLIWEKKKLFRITLPIAFVLSCIWIFPEPRYYTSNVSLAPETVSDNASGGLSAIAATFGMNLGGAQNDAIYPLLYPELFDSNEFIVSLFDIPVKTEDGSVECDYYTYLKKHQKRNWLTFPFKKAQKYIISLFKEKKPAPSSSGEGDSRINPFYMSEDDAMIVELVKANITCAVDKKTDVTTIMVKDQDPLVCANMANSVKERLQQFITDYRTSKARQDMLYYEELCVTAKNEYDRAVKEYSDYCDSHQGIILQSFISERDALETNMSLKLNAYNAMRSQHETAKAKVQECTPAFTTLKSASVPIKPAGPKRMLFVAGMMFLTFMCTCLWICRSEFMGVKEE